MTEGPYDALAPFPIKGNHEQVVPSVEVTKLVTYDAYYVMLVKYASVCSTNIEMSKNEDS